MALDSSLNTALQGAAPLVCLLIKVELADRTIRMVDGAGEVALSSDLVPSANLYDTAEKQSGWRVNSSDGNLAAVAGWACSDWIPVTAGQTYTISANGTKRQGLSFFASYGATTSVASSYVSSATLPLTVTAPVGATHMVVNVASTTITEPTEIMINAGSSALPYQTPLIGATYSGEDDVYGILDSIETVSEQVGTEAPMVQLTFLPATIDALADLTNPANQGASVRIWFGAVDPATGLLIGEPELLFFGEFDTAEAETNRNRTVITFNITSAWERLFAMNEGHRLNNAFLQSVYPGALGCQFVTEIQRDLPWGYDSPRPNVVADVSGGGFSGGFSTGETTRRAPYPNLPTIAF